MGAGKDFFDELEIDYTSELPEGSGQAVERLLYLLKRSMNGDRITLRATPTGEGGENVSCSTEWLAYFGYTLEELQALGIDFFEDESQEVATIHAANKLAAPYVANVKRNGKVSKLQNVQGMNILVGDIEWRAVIYSPFG